MTIITRIRRWCAPCGQATLSEMCPVCHQEVCAQCGDGHDEGSSRCTSCGAG